MALSTLVETPTAPGAHFPSVFVPLPLAEPEALEDAGSEICLVVSVEKQNYSTGQLHREIMHVLPQETIRDLKLRLRNRGWLTSHHCLLFGDRKLLDHELIGRAVPAGNGADKDLHVFVRLSDVESVNVRTLKRELSLSGLPDSPRSTLNDRLLPYFEQDRALPPPEGFTFSLASGQVATARSPEAVVHLRVRKSAKVLWKHLAGDKFELSISSSDTVESLKRKIEANQQIDAGACDVLFAGQVLSSGRALQSYGIGKGSVLELVPVEPGNIKEFPDGSPLLSTPAHELYENWQRARQGLAEGLSPTLSKAGTGGSYFLQDAAGQNVAVFKPEDEEPRAVNNPKGICHSPTGEGLRRGSIPGEGAVREVAAYLLDHEHFAGVPPTALVQACLNGSETKRGSLQQFVVSEYDCEERGPSDFPVHQVHKIAVLDIRLANTDRNGGNILAKRYGDTWQLVPIDHGYCLPASFEDISFEWLYWPQAKVPFDSSTVAYIESLDTDKDVGILQAHNLDVRPECILVLQVCTLLLQKAVARGMTAYQIGCIMSRQALMKSPLEKLHHLASHQAFGSAGVSWHAPLKSTSLYMARMADLLDEYLEEFVLDSADLYV